MPKPLKKGESGGGHGVGCRRPDVDGVGPKLDYDEITLAIAVEVPGSELEIAVWIRRQVAVEVQIAERRAVPLARRRSAGTVEGRTGYDGRHEPIRRA
jgi:hypothetical protein